MATTKIQTFAGQVEVNSNLSVDTNTLHVDSVAGRVGIGKTDPAYAMDVNGTVNATSLYVDGSEFVSGLWTESGSNIYYTSGNVGIGTATAPQKTLEVAGPMRITDGATNVSDLSVELGSWTLQSKLTAPDAAQGDYFGESVSISGDGSYALVGVPKDDGPAGTPQPNYGSAYIFSRSGSTWTFQSKITAPDAGAAQFGYSVSISSDGSYALMGAFYDYVTYPTTGSAYIFSRSGSTWSFQQKILAPDKGPGDFFGWSVSLSSDGSYAVATAPGDDTGGTFQNGAAYIFSRSGSTWTYQSKLTAPDAATDDWLGESVSISGDGSYAIAGAYQDDRPGQPVTDNAGSAYIWVRSGSTWTFQSKLTAPDGVRGDSFGNSVAISSDGSYALVGVRYDDVTYGDQGSAYIFSRSGSTWTYQSKLTAPDAYLADSFGYDVSISSDGSYALVGATLTDDVAANSGSAYIFSRSGTNWSFQHKILAPDAAQSDEFGNSVSISGDGSYALVGAWKDD